MHPVVHLGLAVVILSVLPRPAQAGPGRALDAAYGLAYSGKLRLSGVLTITDELSSKEREAEDARELAEYRENVREQGLKGKELEDAVASNRRAQLRQWERRTRRQAILIEIDGTEALFRSRELDPPKRKAFERRRPAGVNILRWSKDRFEEFNTDNVVLSPPSGLRDPHYVPPLGVRYLFSPGTDKVDLVLAKQAKMSVSDPRLSGVPMNSSDGIRSYRLLPGFTEAVWEGDKPLVTRQVIALGGKKAFEHLYSDHRAVSDARIPAKIVSRRFVWINPTGPTGMLRETWTWTFDEVSDKLVELPTFDVRSYMRKGMVVRETLTDGKVHTYLYEPTSPFYWDAAKRKRDGVKPILAGLGVVALASGFAWSVGRR